MKATLYFFVRTIKNHLEEECWGLFFAVLYTVTVFLSPQISKFLVDDVLIRHHFQNIYVGIYAFFFVCIIQMISGYIKNRIFFRVSEKITFSMRRKILKSLINTSMEFFDGTPKGFIFSRFFDDSRTISDFITNIFVIIVKNTLLIMVITCGMFLLSWKITLLLLVMLSLYILLNVFASKRFKEFSQITLLNNDMLHKDFSQSMDNIFLTKVFGLQDYYFCKVKNDLKNIFSTNVKINDFSNQINSFSSIMIVFSLAVIYGFGAFLSIQNEISIGSIVALGVYFQMLLGPINEMISSNTTFQGIIPVIKRIEEYLNFKPESEREKSKKKSRIIAPLSVIFNEVNFNRSSVNENIHILKNINFAFRENGIYGLFGPSGCGKTTILKLLMGLYLPTAGRIDIISGGSNIYSPYEVRQKISYVSQIFEFINASIFDNLTLFNSSITQEEIIEVCQSLYLHSKIMSLQDDYRSIINENINLSEGEKQRICIARAILRKSFIYIFDEPTAFLDENSKNRVQSIIENLAKEHIVIVVSHDPHMLRNSKKIIVMNNGEIFQECDYSNLIAYINKRGYLNYE